MDLLSRWLRGGFSTLEGLLVPTQCLVCFAQDRDFALAGICIDCERTLERTTPQDCERMPREHPLLGGRGLFRRVVTAVAYAPPVTDLIYALKFGAHAHAAVPLGALLESMARTLDLRAELDALVPVPSHRFKIWTRGIDHTQLIAEELARGLALPVLSGALRRPRATVAQSQASGLAERERQVRDAFEANAQVVNGLRLGLVDDLLTTGATLASCARSLLKAGAGHVLALAVAGRAREAGPESTWPT